MSITFLARHGLAHNIPPHAVNYRANCWAMKTMGVDHLLGVNAFGAIRPAINASDLDFAGLCVISNIASGLSDDPVNHQDILVLLETAMINARKLIRAVLVMI